MPNLQLDAIVRRIIVELQADARLTNVELAERVVCRRLRACDV